MGKKDKAKNMAQVAKGKVEKTVGKTTGDRQLETKQRRSDERQCQAGW